MPTWVVWWQPFWERWNADSVAIHNNGNGRHCWWITRMSALCWTEKVSSYCCSVVLFGLMVTRLNKHYYCYYHIVVVTVMRLLMTVISWWIYLFFRLLVHSHSTLWAFLPFLPFPSGWTKPLSPTATPRRSPLSGEHAVSIGSWKRIGEQHVDVLVLFALACSVFVCFEVHNTSRTRYMVVNQLQRWSHITLCVNCYWKFNVSATAHHFMLRKLYGKHNLKCKL